MRLGDLDGDAIPDMSIGATNRCPQGYFGDAGTIRTISGATGAITLEVVGPDSVAEFGAAICSIADLSGDGVADLVVGAPGEAAGSVPRTGSVLLVSGSSGQVFRTITRGAGSGSAERFGSAVAAVGDASGDGVADVVVGSPMTPNAAAIHSGVAFLFSGADGSVVDSVSGTDSDEGFGSRVASIGDWNGDGDIDVAISSPTRQVPGGGTGQVLLFDVAHMTPIDTLSANASDVMFGGSLAMLGDVDGDGFADLGVGAPGVGSGEVGHVYVYSRVQAVPIVTLTGLPGDQFGSALDSGDIDGDGELDLIIGAKGFSADGLFHRGAVYFHTAQGPSGQIVTVGNGTFSELGTSLTAVNDLNGDGRPEILIGAPGENDAANVYGVGQAAVWGYVTVAAGRTFVRGNTLLRVGQGYADPRIQVEPVAGAFDLSMLRPETLSLSVTSKPNLRIPGSGLPRLEDSDNNGVLEASIQFPSKAVMSLFDSYGPGQHVVGALVEGDLVDGRRVVAPGNLTIDIAVPMKVSASPNPSRGEAILAFRTEAEAFCQIDLFDVQGQRVGHWSSPGAIPPGFKQISLSTLLGSGRNIASGIYFYVVTVGKASQVGRVAIIR